MSKHTFVNNEVARYPGMKSPGSAGVRSRLGSRQEKTNIVSLNLDVSDRPKNDPLSPDMHRMQRAYKKLKVTNNYLNN